MEKSHHSWTHCVHSEFSLKYDFHLVFLCLLCCVLSKLWAISHFTKWWTHTQSCFYKHENDKILRIMDRTIWTVQYMTILRIIDRATYIFFLQSLKFVLDGFAMHWEQRLERDPRGQYPGYRLKYSCLFSFLDQFVLAFFFRGFMVDGQSPNSHWSTLLYDKAKGNIKPLSIWDWKNDMNCRRFMGGCERLHSRCFQIKKVMFVLIVGFCSM